MIVVADASPLRYLVLIDAVDVIHALYGGVLIPPAVLRELSQSRTPDKVRGWIALKPAWLVVQQPLGRSPDISAALGPGEREAITLAIEVCAAVLLIDDWAGRREAARCNLPVQGTLGLLSLAAEHNLIDLRSAITRLGETNFRATQKMMRTVLDKHNKPGS